MSLEHWETYYRGGTLATCPTSPDGGYDLELRAAWAAFFAALPSSARVLDVGTGNGAVALIARETAIELGRAWEIHGSDLAQIDPARHVRDGASRFASVSFHPGVAMENLPFADESFDAVSGQYALEYADTAAALTQVRRVLKPGGRAQFIVHHTESLLVRNAHLSLREAQLVLDGTQVYRHLRRLATMEQLVPGTTQRAADELRGAIQTLKQALPQARELGGGHILGVTLDAVQKLLDLRTRMRPEAVGLEVARTEGELRASVARLNDLVSRARSDEGIAGLEAQAVAADFSIVERVIQYHAGANVVGWRLLLKRS